MKNNAENNITKPKTKKTKKKPSFVHNVKKKYKIKPNFQDI